MNRLIPLALLASAALFAAPLAAQDDPYAACAAMPDNADRLACFDTTYAGRAATGTVREEAQREETFGLSPAEIRAPERRAEREDDAPEAPEFTLTAAVTEAFEDGLGKNVLLLDNGQLWRETAGSSLRSLPREGWQASITQSWSGAYQMRFEGKRGFLRVERIR